MKIKQTIITFVALMGLGGMFLAPLTANAATCGGVTTSIISCGQTGTCPTGENPYEGTDPKGDIDPTDGKTMKSKYKEKYKHDYGVCKNKIVPTPGVENSGVWGLLLIVINILTTGIGIAAVAGIVYGSILYSAAGDSADKVTKARAVIRNVVIGIVAYALMYAALNFIIPGGLFTS